MTLITISKKPSELEVTDYIKKVTNWFNEHPTRENATVQFPWGGMYQIRSTNIEEDIRTHCKQ